MCQENLYAKENGMGWNMFLGPKAQRWDQQGHSAPKMRKKEIRQSEAKHPTKLVKAATSCLISPPHDNNGLDIEGDAKERSEAQICRHTRQQVRTQLRDLLGK